MQVKIRTQQVQRAAVHKTTARTYTRVASSDIYTRTLAIPSFFARLPLFQSVVALFAISLFLYLYMVISIIVATVDRKSLEEKIRSESTELTYKETEYSKRISSITLATVYAEGYVDSGEQGFAKRQAVPTLTLANE